MAQRDTLVPLTDEEITVRGKILARMCLDLDELRSEHAEEKKMMKAREDELKGRMTKLARSMRDGREKDEP